MTAVPGLVEGPEVSGPQQTRVSSEESYFMEDDAAAELTHTLSLTHTRTHTHTHTHTHLFSTVLLIFYAPPLCPLLPGLPFLKVFY